MALKEHRYSRAGIAALAAGLMVSPRARRTARKGLISAGSAATKVFSTAIRGTRNLQEAQKHVTRFEVKGGDSE